jgi:hypothetical protein
MKGQVIPLPDVLRSEVSVQTTEWLPISWEEGPERGGWLKMEAEMESVRGEPNS